MAANDDWTGTTPADTALEGKRVRHFAKRLYADLSTAIESGDLEAIRHVMWRISGHLRPALLTTVTEYRKPEIADTCAEEFARLKALFDTARAQGLFDDAPATVADTLATFNRLESCFRFVQSIERPELTRAKRLADSLKRRESDHEVFLSAYRGELGLLGSGLDAYIAQVLLGMRMIDGELNLPGDLTVIRSKREIPIAQFSDAEIRHRVLNFARARRDFDQKARMCEAGIEQLSAVDELEIAKLSFSLRWRISIDWNDVGQMLDDRTAHELNQVLAGCPVAEMGKTAYNHFREQLPRIRKIAFDVRQTGTKR
jgi:hypothetical protein